MPSQIDFAISVGLFVTFLAIMLVYLISFMQNYSGILTTSELRSAAQDLFTTLTSGGGVPSDWEIRNTTPVKIGLTTNLYRQPFRIIETNGTSRANITFNGTFSLDFDCEKRAWHDTIRLYDADNNEMTFSLYNQTYCSERYVNKTDVVFNMTLTPNQVSYGFVYFSPDKSIQPPNYTMTFNTTTNFTLDFYPPQTLTELSVNKIKALKNVTFSNFLYTLGAYFKVRVEVVE